MKEVKQRSNKRSKQGDVILFYLYIINHIRRWGRLPTPEEARRSKQNINYYVKQLKIKELIYSIGYSCWRVNEEKVKETSLEEVKQKGVDSTSQFKKGISKEIRGHAFTIKVHHKVRNLPIIAEKKFKGKWINNNSVFSSNIKHRVIWFSKRSIVIYFNKEESFFSDSAKQSKEMAIYKFKSLMTNLERELNKSLKIKKEWNFEVSRQEYANINNELAEDFNKKQNKLRCYYNGKCWLLIDNSLNLNELEAVNPKTSDKDMDKVVMPFFNDLKHRNESNKDFIISDIMDRLEKQQEILMQNQINLTKSQKINADQIGMILGLFTKRDEDKPSYIG